MRGAGAAGAPCALPWGRHVTSGVDWRGVLAAGVACGLRPAEVWDLTPWEFLVLLGPVEAPLGRSALDALMARYPDEKG